MTDLEYQTLFLWLTRKIYLEKYPRFLRATMVNMQRDVFADHHMKHLVYKLTSPKVLLNLGIGTRRKTVDALFTAQYTTTCEPKDQMVVLTLIRPDVRNKWKNRTLPFTRKTSVTLKSADTLSNDEPFLGYDEGALALQYSCLFMHRAALTHQQARAIGKVAAGSEPIDVVCMPLVDSPFAPHFWKITYDLLRCPTQLINVRMLNVTQGDFKISITVHHERSAFRYPCNACLSVKHATKDCTTQNKEQPIERFTKDIEIPLNEEVSGLSQTRTVKELKDVISRAPVTVQSTPTEASKADVNTTEFSAGVAPQATSKPSGRQQPPGTRSRTPRLSVRSSVAARRSSAPTIPSIPINHAFVANRPTHAETTTMTRKDELSERRTKSEEDFVAPPTSFATTENQAGNGDPDDSDVLMPYGVGIVSPRKRQRPVKEDVEEDGDAKMTFKDDKKVISKTKPPSKKEKRAAEAHANVDSDDLEPEEIQPTFEYKLKPQAGNSVSGKKVPGVQSSVTEFFAPSLVGFLGASSEVMPENIEGEASVQGVDTCNHEEAAHAHADHGRETPTGSSQGDDVQVCYPEMLATQLDTLQQWKAHFEAIYGSLDEEE